jgi:hypothetical protein
MRLGLLRAALAAAAPLAVVGSAVAAIATSSTASPLAAQSLAREIEAAPDGWVVFQYALESDVEICSDGHMRRGGSWRGGWSDDHDDLCARGVAQAELRVQDGEVTDVEIRPPSGGRRANGDGDLGERNPQEVADYFMTLASESRHRDVSEDALMPAVVARGVTVWPQLKDIALDRGLGDDVREGAVFWLSQVDSERALEALEEILTSSDEPDIQERAIFAVSQHESSRSTEILQGYAEQRSAPENLRENAIFWLGQSDGSGEFLGELYLRVDSRELKEKIIFGLSQGSHGGEAADRLMEIALNEPDRDLQRTALFWLGQSDDPRVAEFLLELILPTAVR